MDQAERRRLGQRLQAMRKERQLTQEELADRAGLHPTHVAKIEAGVSWPSIPALLRIARALAVQPSKFFAPEPEHVDPSVTRALQGVVSLLRNLSEDDIAFVRDVLIVLKRHGKLPPRKADPADKQVGD